MMNTIKNLWIVSFFNLNVENKLYKCPYHHIFSKLCRFFILFPHLESAWFGLAKIAEGTEVAFIFPSAETKKLRTWEETVTLAGQMLIRR